MRPDAPNEKRPWLLFVWVELRAPRADGLSSGDEAPTLHEIEESLNSMIPPVCGAQLVGRITGSNRREFYFYGEEPGELEAAVARAMQPFPGYVYESGSTFQPEWEQYLELLYPSPSNLQRMMNRRLLDSLAQQGDAHEMPRKVDHWLEFATPEARAAARSTLEAIEFAVEGVYEGEPGAELPHALVVSRVDPVDMRTINGITLELARLAQEHGGNYDGWESPVTKPS